MTPRWPRTLALLLGALVTSPAVAEDPSGLCDGYAGLPEADGPTAGMVRIAGGTFTMGADDQRPEERAAHPVSVSGFWIDRHEVTNAQFRAFVEATGYRTVAERGLDPEAYPHLPPGLLVPGGMVFSPPAEVASLEDVTQWWRYVPGASWRHPLGPESDIAGKDAHPVVQIAFEDALAYAGWAGRALPTEAEWEFAARGGLEGATYVWGDTYDPLNGWQANTWQGRFPVENQELDGFALTAPVGCFAPNGYGLVDMAGNVWEYTHDLWLPGHRPAPVADPTGPSLQEVARMGAPVPSVVIKGGSHLCAPNYCLRYRPAGRQPQELSLGTSHIGFRTVLRDPTPNAGG